MVGSDLFVTDDMEALPKIVRQRLRSGNRPGGHPHADLLTAFAEKALTERERTRVMEHLSRCEDCREVMFLSAPQEAPVQALGKIPGRAGWLSWPVLRWGAAVACVVVVGTAVTLHHQSQNRAVLNDRVLNEKAESAAPSAAPAPSAATVSNVNLSAELKAKDTRPNPGAGAAADKLAKLEAPARPQPKAMTATPQFQMQFDQPQQSRGYGAGRKEPGASGAIGGSAGAASGMVVAPAPAKLEKGANSVSQPESDQKQAPAGGSRDALNAPASMNETVTVEVQASSPIVQTEAVPVDVAKSKDASEAQLPIEGRNMQDLAQLSTADAARPDSVHSAKKALARAFTKIASQWMLTSGGVLQRSLDAGKTWETVPVADNVSFQTFAVVAADIWVGGANGLLYHSSDAGLHWVQVIPRAKGESLTAGITKIEFSDSQNGKVTTANGETWTTSNAGKTWRRKLNRRR